VEVADSAQSRMDNVNMCNRKLGRSPGILPKCYLNLRGADPLLSHRLLLKLKIQDTEDARSVTPLAKTVPKSSIARKGGYVSEIGNERGMRKAKYICSSREDLCTPPATRRNVEVAPDGGGGIGKYALSQWSALLAEAGAPTEAGGGFS